MKIKFNNLCYGVLLVLFCTRRFWGSDIPWYINPVISIIGIFLLFQINRFKIKLNKQIYINAILAIAPLILIVMYSLLLWFFKWEIQPRHVVTNLFSSNLYMILSVLFASSVYYVFGNNGINLTYRSACISYILGSVIYIIFQFGFKESLFYLVTSSSINNSLLFSMEVNDLTFAFGILFIYYLFFGEEQKNRRKIIIVCSIMIYWGLKRIEIAALLVCCLCYILFIKKCRIRTSKIIITISVMLVSYIYVMFIHTSALTDLASKYQINFMGRLGTYSYIAQNYSNFSFSFMGRGVGYIDELIESLQSTNLKIGYATIISLHSDTLRMYIGLGFLGFGLWIFYQIYVRASLMKRYFSDKTIKLYLTLSIYNFILYLTDNTYTDPVTCFTFVLVLLSTFEGSSLKKVV